MTSHCWFVVSPRKTIAYLVPQKWITKISSMTDICFYYIFRTVQPNFIKFSPKILKYISLYESVIISIWQKTKWRPKWRAPRYLCLLYLFNRSIDFHQILYFYNKMASKMASTKIFVFTISLQLFNQFSSNFHQKYWNIFSAYKNLL